MKEATNIHARTIESPPSAMNIGDVYYLLFHHKWKIIVLFLVSVVVALTFYLVQKPLYRSEAKILIRYILENSATTPTDADAQMKSPDSRGDNIINSEIEILTSLDLAAQVADTVTPQRILAMLGGGNDRMMAAGEIRRNLQVDVPKNSSILRITFRHPDSTIVQSTLRGLVDTYLKRHIEIHQGVGVLDDFFLRQTDQLRLSLTDTESKLKGLRAAAQIISLADSKRAYTDQLSRISAELLAAEAELAERQAALQNLGQEVALNTGATNVPAVVPQEEQIRYQQVSADLTEGNRRLMELRTRYWDEHIQVRHLQQQVAEYERQKQKLEDEHPQLRQLAPVAVDSSRPTVDLSLETMRVTGLQAKIKVLASQLEQVRTNAARIIDVEPEITALERKREMDEASYRYYSSSLEKARIDETLGVGKITNISVVQTPSPPGREVNDVLKPIMMILLVGCFGGIAWGFVSDRFLSQTIKTVSEVERCLPAPLFLTAPDVAWKKRALPWFSRNGHSAGAANGDKADQIAAKDADPQLRAYYEGLRDRLITYFEVRNMTHKPKLVALTSCAPGAGVTTMAAGLAATLSETGDGNVLLVDMNIEQGAAHQFYQGKPARGLSEALEGGSRDQACVSENFYMVTAHETNKQNLPRVLPKRFASLVPKMKASDYDYIIFDMPPVTQTSVTARLSGFMDMVLVVVESERTGREILKRSYRLLSESHANVATVLNKNRNYVPRKLSQEL